MRLLGTVFVVLSAGSVGFQMAANLRKHCLTVRQFLVSLQVLKNEIMVYRTPLPQAFAKMAASVQEPLASLYSDMAKDMTCNCWVTPYDAACHASKTHSEEAFCGILLQLSQTLGKYDLEAQMIGIEKAVSDGEALLHTLEEDRRLKSRTYRTLGICTGLAVAILLV